MSESATSGSDVFCQEDAIRAAEQVRRSSSGYMKARVRLSRTVRKILVLPPQARALLALAALRMDRREHVVCRAYAVLEPERIPERKTARVRKDADVAGAKTALPRIWSWGFSMPERTGRRDVRLPLASSALLFSRRASWPKS